MDKVEVCKRRELGWSCAELGREFGVSRQRIWAIVEAGRQHWYGRGEKPGRPEKSVLPEGYLDELKRIARQE